MASSDNRTTLVLGIVVAMLALGGIIISLRVYARTVLKRGAFGRDDTLIVVTWVSLNCRAMVARLTLTVHYPRL